MTSPDRLREGAYDLVRYVDPWGRFVTTMAALMPLMPEWVEPETFNWRDDLVTKLKDPGDVGPQVWHIDVWKAGFESGLTVHIPMVFSLNGVVYVVMTDAPVRVDETGQLSVQVVPLVIETPGGRVANADALDLVFELSRADYLADLQRRALRKYPPISVALLVEAGLDIKTLTLIEGRKLRGAKFGASLVRARPTQDLDLIDLNLLCGDDEGRLFLSELPERVSTLRKAYSALCPLTRSEAEQSQRQGEWWFLPVPDDELGPHGRPEGEYLRSSNVKTRPLTKKQQVERALRPRALRGPDHGFSGSYGGRLALIIPESNHFCTEVVRDEAGYVWARGKVRHRLHEHEPVELDGWHLVLHNGQVRAWSTGRFHT